ncbi:hypothetical protein [Timonella senegalensis]|uniref:hypothetical protein n=1 Tax=Timonella senegalensis TaxID=1465825 RepID=UPI002FDCC40E
MILLDLYCCEGGAARGYKNAGFEVFGVDLLPKFAKRYAGDWFTAASALEVLTTLNAGGSVTFHNRAGESKAITLDDIMASHASPPCQAYSITKHGHSKQHPMLIEPTRELLEATGKPYVIENVVGAPLNDPTMLCWSMFYPPGAVIDEDGTPLRMERHRLFETNWPLTTPRADHHPKDVQVAGSYGGARRDKWEARHVRKGGYVPAKHIQEQLLGIDWMTQYGLYQSLPPVYTEWIGHQLATHIIASR